MPEYATQMYAMQMYAIQMEAIPAETHTTLTDMMHVIDFQWPPT